MEGWIHKDLAILGLPYSCWKRPHLTEPLRRKLIGLRVEFQAGHKQQLPTSLAVPFSNRRYNYVLVSFSY
jgi:hypothetical protein